MTPLAGFAPDASPTTPGIFTDCQNLIPTDAGFSSAASPVPVVVAPLPGICQGAAVLDRLNSTRRVIAGTPQRLYELVDGAWVDQSKSGGYTGSVETVWSLTQFGDTTVASNLADPMQSSLSGQFSDVPNAPKAKIVVSASNNFLIAFNTVDPTYGVSPDRWWNSAQSDQTSWTPNVSTLANTGRLVAVGGPITAARTLGDYVVAYKGRAIFLGSFVGSPVVWQWNLIPGSEAGCVGPEAVCDIGVAHFMVGEDDFWVFDGTRPSAVGSGVVRKWFAANCSALYKYRCKASYDRQLDCVYIDYPSIRSLGECDSRLVFHLASKRWGRVDADVQAALNFVSPGVTIDGLNAYSATIDGLPNIPVDSPFWSAGGRMSAYFDGTNTLVSRSGVSGVSSFTTGDLGDDDVVTMLDQFRVRFTMRPTTATANGLYKFNEGEVLTIGPASPIADGRFNLRQSGRFHRVKVDMTGTHSETAMQAKPVPVGQR